MPSRSRRPQRPQRRKIRWTRLTGLLIILLIMFTSLAWAAVYTYQKLSQVSLGSMLPTLPAFSAKVDTKKTPEPVNKNINILLLGIDDGDNEHPDAPQRSDTIIVASINPDNGKINILSIPRDTKVMIPGHKGSEKITHAFFYGGTELAKSTVENLLQIQIQYSMIINWQAFIQTVDVLGGVDLYVEKPMHYEDPYENLIINLTTGYQHLDGNQAGQYVRFRSDELGDIGRVQRQQRFLKAMAEQTLQFNHILKIPSFVHVMEKNVTTDMTGFTMLKLASYVKFFKPDQMHTEMLPGNFATIDEISYWVHDKQQTKQIAEHMFMNDTTK